MRSTVLRKHLKTLPEMLPTFSPKKGRLGVKKDSFDDVDMSKSNLRNNKTVLNPILIGDDTEYLVK